MPSLATLRGERLKCLSSAESHLPVTVEHLGRCPDAVDESPCVGLPVDGGAAHAFEVRRPSLGLARRISQVRIGSPFGWT